MSDTLKIVNKNIEGIEVTGYVLADSSGNNLRTLHTQDVVKLCKKGLIENAEAILDTDTGEYVVYLTDLVSKKERIKKDQRLNIEYRVVNSDNKCIGYVFSDLTGKTYKADINKVWALALNDGVNGIRASIIGTKKVIESVGQQRLADLPVINMDDV